MEFTAEQLNYFRICHIAFNLVPERLQKVFKQEWDFRYKTTPLGEWKDTPQNGRDFYNNESRRSRTKNARYLAIIQNGNTAEWDCSCLFFAILYSDSIGTTLGPTVNKDVDDLRQVRNDIDHMSEAKLTDAEFQNCLTKVLEALNSLKLPVIDVEIEAVKNQLSFSAVEVSSLKMQADKLKAELMREKSDLQTKEEELKTLTSDVQTKEEELNILSCEVAHNTLYRKEAEIEKLAAELQLAHTALQTKQEEVETLNQEINSKVESFCSLPFKPSHESIRRSNDVTRIMKKLEELKNKGNGLVSSIYLSGNSGCGKSEIARQVGQEFFDKSFRENEGLTFVATLNAQTLETLANSYISLARQLSITEYTLTCLATSKEGDPKETIQHVKRLILPEIQQFCSWLLIVDNVVDLPLVLGNLPPTTSEEWDHGQLLITTQDTSSIPSNAPHTYHESLSGGMQPDDAVELLRLVSQISNQEEAEKVAEILEYQPLALAAAACYVHTVVTNCSPNFSWSDYLESFGRSEHEATEEPLPKQNSAYSKTMTTAIKMAINTALESDEVFREAFCLFSLCVSDSLPIEAVVNFVKFRVTGQTEEAIRTKIVKSLLTTCFHGEDGIPYYVRVRNIVHEVLKVTLALGSTDRVQCISEAIKVFHSLIEAERNLLFSSRYAGVKLRTIMTHCKVLNEILVTDFAVKELVVKELTSSNTPDNVVSWLCSAAKVCCHLSNPSDAILFSTSACECVEYMSGTRQGDLLKAEAFFLHGYVLSLEYKHELSLKYYEQARIIRIEIYGEEHADVAACYSKLGTVYRDIKQYRHAKEQYEKALIIRRTIYGEHHADVAASYSSLGAVHGDLKQYGQAKEYLEKALVIGKKIYGEGHARVASSYHNLGLHYYGLKQYSQAQECDEKALKIRKKVYGEQHALVACSYNNLGVTYVGLKQYIPAKECQEKALIIAKQNYGQKHGHVALNYRNLGALCNYLGQYSQAEEHLEKALVITKKIYGEQHADVARSYSLFGSVYSNQGHYSQAKEQHEKALIIREKIYGEEHADVAHSYHNLGSVYNDQGHYSEAKEKLEEALIINRKVFGEEHADVARSYHNLGLVYKKLGQDSQAIEQLEKALIINRKVFGEHHADVALGYSVLGNVYSGLLQDIKAKEHHEKALVIRKKIYGEQHADVARSYNNLGNAYSDLGQYILAKECYEKALNIYKKIYGEQSAFVDRSYRNLRYNRCNQVIDNCCTL